MTTEEIKKNFETNQMLLNKGAEILDLLGKDVYGIYSFSDMRFDYEHDEEVAFIYGRGSIRGERYGKWYNFPLVYLTMTDEEILADKLRRDAEYKKFLEEQRKREEEAKALEQEKRDRELYEQLKKRFRD